MVYSEAMDSEACVPAEKGPSLDSSPVKAVFTSDLSACHRVLSEAAETQDPAFTAWVLETPSSLVSSFSLTVDSTGKLYDPLSCEQDKTTS